MSKRTLADFASYVQRATSFQVFYSGPDFFTGSGLLDNPEEIRVYTGVDEKQNIYLDVGKDPRFFLNLTLTKDIQINIIEDLKRPDPFCKVIFEKGNYNLVFQFWM